MASYFKISGDKKLIAKLSKLEKAARGPVLRKGLRAAAKVIQQEAKRMAPVGDSGTVKKAIKVRAAKRKRGKGKAGWTAGVNVTIGTRDFVGKSFYGAFLEYGTKTKDGNVKIQPRQFMKRAFDHKKTEAKKVALESFRLEILRLATR